MKIPSTIFIMLKHKGSSSALLSINDGTIGDIRVVNSAWERPKTISGVTGSHFTEMCSGITR